MSEQRSSRGRSKPEGGVSPLRLVLLRHAKAVGKDEADFDRVLAPRGQAQMAAVARYLAGRDGKAIRPDLALVSPAARTRETWAATKLAKVEARFEPTIYEAPPKTLLALVRAVEAGPRTVMLVGHNPGIEDLADKLTGGEASEFPTAALAVIAFEASAWGEIRRGRLERFVTPDDLGVGKTG